MDEQVALRQAGGVCQCTGECGHTHGWSADVKPRRCRAPHGCAIVRKLDYPSCWQLAGSERVPLEHPEHYAVDKPVLVELRSVKVADGRDGVTLALCQRCKLLVEEAAGTGKKRTGKKKK